jgi:hypothetical protein
VRKKQSGAFANVEIAERRVLVAKLGRTLAAAHVHEQKVDWRRRASIAICERIALCDHARLHGGEGFISSSNNLEIK